MVGLWQNWDKAPLSAVYSQISATLPSMQGWRAPGVDGLTAILYKVLWDIVTHTMLKVFKESLVLSSVTLSCQRAVVTLLPKRVIHRTSKINALCHSLDCKIISGALDNTLVICHNQTYCVSGRSRVDKSLFDWYWSHFIRPRKGLTKFSTCFSRRWWRGLGSALIS